MPVAASVECEDGPERSARRGLKRTSESKAKSHVCSTCGRVCKTAGDLASHVRIHFHFSNVDNLDWIEFSKSRQSRRTKTKKATKIVYHMYMLFVANFIKSG